MDGWTFTAVTWESKMCAARAGGPVHVRAPDQVIGGQLNRGCYQGPVAGGYCPAVQSQRRRVRPIGRPGSVEKFAGAGQFSPQRGMLRAIMSRSPAVMAWVCAGSAYMSSTYFTVASFRSRPCHPVIRPDHALAPGGPGHSAPAQPPTRHYLAAPGAFAKVLSYRSLGAVSGHDDLHRPGLCPSRSPGAVPGPAAPGSGRLPGPVHGLLPAAHRI